MAASARPITAPFTRYRMGAPSLCCSTLGAEGATLQEDSKGLTATGVAEAAQKSMDRNDSRSIKITFSEQDTFKVTITKEDVAKCIKHLGDDSSEED